jgi:magnesium chelatase subunit I
VFNRNFRADDFSDFLQHFSAGRSLEVSDTMPTAVYSQKMQGLSGLNEAIRRLQSASSPALTASAVEFILEGLHLNKKLNKKTVEGEISYWG